MLTIQYITDSFNSHCSPATPPLTNCDHPHLRFGTCFDIWRATNSTYLLTYLLTRLHACCFNNIVDPHKILHEIISNVLSQHIQSIWNILHILLWNLKYCKVLAVTLRQTQLQRTWRLVVHYTLHEQYQLHYFPTDIIHYVHSSLCLLVADLLISAAFDKFSRQINT